MIAEAMKVGYVARSGKQGRKEHGKFARYAYIVGMPEDVAAELQRQGVASLPHARNPHTGDPHTGDPHTGFGSALSTKRRSLENTDHKNQEHHQFRGHPPTPATSDAKRPSETTYSPLGRSAISNGMTFVWVGSEPYNAWLAFRGADGAPPIDTAIIDGVERRGAWFVSLYPPRMGRTPATRPMQAAHDRLNNARGRS